MKRDPSQGACKIKIEKKWYQGHSLDHKAFENVWVEHDSNVTDTVTAVRAVKEISKDFMQRIRLDYKRELIALATLSKIHCIIELDLNVVCEKVKTNFLF